MVNAIELRLLGPIDVRVNGSAVPLRGVRQQRLLAALALDVGQIVTTDRLVDVVWPLDAPITARRQVQDLISRLRRDLAAAGCAETVITTHGSGYLLRIPPESVDASRFQDGVAAGRALRDRDPRSAAATLRRALGLWRDDALAGLTCPALEAARVHLDELRLMTWEQCIDIELGLGLHDDVLSDLAALAEAHPSRERLIQLYMHALYRVGRTTDALYAFHRIRRHLSDDIGLNPGPDLQRMHDAILRDDPALLRRDEPVAVDAVRGPRQDPVVPAHLPPDVSGFAGRRSDLARIDDLVFGAGRDGRAGTALVTAIAGMPGIGKTALAVRWAHSAADRFPDGQLYINLRGYDRREPLSPGKALALLLTALGVPSERIPVDEDAAGGLWRSLLSDKRIVVVLDNARSVDQVRPLLPGGPGNVVVITSRDTLKGLVALNDAVSLPLGVLRPEEALDLLARTLGPHRVTAEARAASRLAELCGHLPLALRIAAAHLSFLPDTPIETFIAGLAAGDRLGALEVEGDPQSAVRTVFDHSYAALSPAERQVFRVLGAAPAADFGVHAAAALGGLDVATATAILGRLTAAHVLTVTVDGRYGFHDLVREYAAARADPAETAEARSRMLDFYLQVTASANAVLSPRNAGVTPVFGYPPWPLPFRPETDAVVAYLDAEIGNLVDVVRHAAEQRVDDAGWHIAYLLSGYFDRGRHLDTASDVARWGVIAAAACANVAGERRLRTSLGAFCNNAGRSEEALGHLRRAVELARMDDNRRAEAAATNNIGRSYLQLGRYDKSAEAYRRALELYETCGVFDSGIGSALNNLGDVHRMTGDFDLARDYLDRAVAFARQADDPVVEAFALTNIGHLFNDESRSTDALASFHRALTLTRAEGHHYLECEILIGTAQAHRDLGDPDAAIGCLDRALGQATRSGNTDVRATVLVELAAAHLARGEPATR